MATSSTRQPGGTRNDIKHNNDYLVLFADAPPAFAPGTSRRYCNACYVVLGMLIEKVSGEDYYAYIQRHIYEPAGMSHTGSYRVDSLPPNTAIGYTTGQEDAPPGTPLHPNSAELPGRGSAAGGGYSTIGDLLQFVAALRARSIPQGPPAGIGIAGGSGGLNAVLEGDLPGGYDLAVTANLDPPAAERVAQTVREVARARRTGPGRPRPRSRCPGCRYALTFPPCRTTSKSDQQVPIEGHRLRLLPASTKNSSSFSPCMNCPSRANSIPSEVSPNITNQ